MPSPPWSLRYRNDHVVFVSGDGNESSPTYHGSVAIGELEPQCYILIVRAGLGNPPSIHLFDELYSAEFGVEWHLDLHEPKLECRWGSSSVARETRPCLRFNSSKELWEFASAFHKTLEEVQRLKLDVKFGLLLVYNRVRGSGTAQPGEWTYTGITAAQYLGNEPLEDVSLAAVMEKHSGFLSWSDAVESPHVIMIDAFDPDSEALEPTYRPD